MKRTIRIVARFILPIMAATSCGVLFALWNGGEWSEVRGDLVSSLVAGAVFGLIALPFVARRETQETNVVLLGFGAAAAIVVIVASAALALEGRVTTYSTWLGLSGGVLILGSFLFEIAKARREAKVEPSPDAATVQHD
ncbi:MAG: hypothetical protein GY716_23350 [bacterium]|nr:hypothetical protein [bacterium]